MKTCSLYGFIWALAGTLLGLALYFLGYQSDSAKFSEGQWIVRIGGLAIAVTCIVLGIKARRAEVPQTEGFGYGRALGAGVLVSLVACILNAIFTYVYLAFINPGFVDIILQNSLDKLEASGASGDRLDKAEAMTRAMMHPVPLTLYALVIGFIIAVIIALVLAAFLTRPDPNAARA